MDSILKHTIRLKLAGRIPFGGKKGVLAVSPTSSHLANVELKRPSGTTFTIRVDPSNISFGRADKAPENAYDAAVFGRPFTDQAPLINPPMPTMPKASSSVDTTPLHHSGPPTVNPVQAPRLIPQRVHTFGWSDTRTTKSGRVKKRKGAVLIATGTRTGRVQAVDRGAAVLSRRLAGLAAQLAVINRAMAEHRIAGMFKTLAQAEPWRAYEQLRAHHARLARELHDVLHQTQPRRP